MKVNEKPFYLSQKDIEWVNSTYENMTFDEKIGQLFCMVGYGYDEGYLSLIAEKIKVGGMMCRPMSPEEAVKIVSLLQTKSKIPMIISANIESGGSGFLIGGTDLGSPMQVAATGDVSLAHRLGEVCAREAVVAGANLTFAPIVDIDYNYQNPITNTRTFGSDADIVAQMGVAYIESCQKNGLAASAKHFPGDGVDDRDQHLVTTINTLSTKEWDETYGKVYSSCIAAGVKSIMIGHIMLPSYEKYFSPNIADTEILPATLSENIITKLLKQKLHFNGLVVTDATPMNGLNIAMPRDRLVPTLVAAGCDMITFTANMAEDIGFLKKGVQNGVITKERFEEAVKKVLAFKASQKLHERQQNGTLLPNSDQINNVLSHRDEQLMRTCADKAITLVKEEKGVLPITPKKQKRILLHVLGETDGGFFGKKIGAGERLKKLLVEEGFEVEIAQNSSGMEGMMQPFAEKVNRQDLIIYLANLSTKSNQTTVRIEWALPMGINVPSLMHSVPTIFISVANPYHLQDVPRVKTFINAYAATDETLHQIVEKLIGKSEFCGVSPIDPFCGKWDTRL